MRLLILAFCLLLLPLDALAAVEIGLGTARPALIEEVYQREGVAFLPLEEVLAALGLSGDWDAVDHVYRIKTPLGKAVISPGSQYLRLEDRFLPLDHKPRFIDGRLRVAEDLVLVHLQSFLGDRVYYRNLNPPAVTLSEDETPLDRLFAFLLQKKRPDQGAGIRGILIDPGHGGTDPGTIGGGLKEKNVTLEVARQLQKRLKMELGIPVVLTRDSDYALGLQQRFEAAARPEIDVLIQLHAQASLSAGHRGVCLVVRPEEEPPPGEKAPADGRSQQLSMLLADTLAGAGLDVHEPLQAPLLPLGRGNLPTVLVELGFLSNADDAALLGSAEGQERLAAALFKGVKRYADQQKEKL